MEKFACRTKILSGAGAVEALGDLGCKRLFLVTQEECLNDGSAQKVMEAAGAEESCCFAVARATVVRSAQGVAQLREFGADLVAALGGEAALETGKSIAFCAKGDYTLAAIPTVSGWGCEVADTAQLCHDTARYCLKDPKLQPDLAILDSDFLAALSQRQVAEGGFALLAQAVESYTARSAGSLSSLYAREAFCRAYGALPASYAGRASVRPDIQLASSMAGLARTNSGLGLCHALSGTLSRLFPVSQDQLKAIFLPAVIHLNAPVAGRKYAQLARSAGLGGSESELGVRNLKTGLIRLRRELGLPETLVQAGLDPRELWRNMGGIVKMTLDDDRCQEGPLAVEDFLIRRLLEEVMGRI